MFRAAWRSDEESMLYTRVHGPTHDEMVWISYNITKRFHRCSLGSAIQIAISIELAFHGKRLLT